MTVSLINIIFQLGDVGLELLESGIILLVLLLFKSLYIFVDFLLLIFVIDDIFDILLDIFLDLIKFRKNFINLFSFVIICKKLLLGLEGVQHLAEILNLHDRVLFVGHQKKLLTQRVEIGEHVF